MHAHRLFRVRNAFHDHIGRLRGTAAARIFLPQLILCFAFSTSIEEIFARPFPRGDENLGNLLTPNVVREFQRIPENGCLCLIEQLQLILFPFEIDLITIYL